MDYFTPVKDCNPTNKNHKTTTQTREGDWVCLNCNNLNFSFRKKCNRCKTQTRQQNQMTEAYSFYYYPKNYLYVPSTNPLKNSHHTATSVNSKDMPVPSTPLPSSQDKQNKTPEKIYKELPSVSPLVKKYNMREMKSEGSEEKGSSKGSVWGVAVRDFEDTLGGSGRSQESGRQQQQVGDQLQRMINNIIL